MFKNILVPTDGSRLSLKGVRSGVKLAKALGAKVAGVYVMLPYQPATYGEVGPYFGDALSREVYEKAARKNAQKALQAVEREARAAGGSARPLFQTSMIPSKPTSGTNTSSTPSGNT